MLEVTGDRAFRKGGSDLNEFLVHRHFGPTFGPHQGCGGTGKVFGVAGNMEADDITTEQTFQDLLTPGKDGENIIPRERSVMEKGNLQVWTFGSDVSGSQPKVVVMHPHRCTLGGFGACRHGETFVDLFKDLPVRVVDIEIGWKRMKNWPEAFFGCDVIKTGDLFIFQGDSAQSERRRIIHLKPFCAFIRLIVDPSPGNPSAFFAATEEVAKGWNNSVRAFLIDPYSFPVLVF